MLSTSQNKLHQNRYLLIAIAILVLLLALAAPRWEAIPTFSAEEHLTTLSADSVSAYRWNEMAQFYSSQQGNIPVTGENLSTLSADNILAYRWSEMARFYSSQQGHISVNGENLSTLSADAILAYRWGGMAKFYSKQAPTTVKYGPPGR